MDPCQLPGCLRIGVDPVAVHLGGVNLYWYGILVAVGFIAAVRLAMVAAASEGLDEDQLLSALLVAALFGLLGARLFYIFENNPLHSLDPAHLGEALSLWQGGLSFYGAIFGAALGAWIYAARYELPALRLLDIGARPHSAAGQHLRRRHRSGALRDPALPLSPAHPAPWTVGRAVSGRLVDRAAGAPGVQGHLHRLCRTQGGADGGASHHRRRSLAVRARRTRRACAPGGFKDRLAHGAGVAAGSRLRSIWQGCPPSIQMLVTPYAPRVPATICLGALGVCRYAHSPYGCPSYGCPPERLPFVRLPFVRLPVVRLPVVRLPTPDRSSRPAP